MDHLAILNSSFASSTPCATCAQIASVEMLLVRDPRTKSTGWTCPACVSHFLELMDPERKV